MRAFIIQYIRQLPKHSAAKSEYVNKNNAVLKQNKIQSANPKGLNLENTKGI